MKSLGKYEVCPYSHLCDYTERTGLICKGTDPNRATPFWCEKMELIEKRMIDDSPKFDFPHNVQILNEHEDLKYAK